jgi:hypothetical protein
MGEKPRKRGRVAKRNGRTEESRRKAEKTFPGLKDSRPPSPETFDPAKPLKPAQEIVPIFLKHLPGYIVPERKLSFPPISASDSYFNPQNTNSIPVVKIFVFLDLNQKS